MAKTDLNLLIQGHNSQLLAYIYNKTNKSSNSVRRNLSKKFSIET